MKRECGRVLIGCTPDITTLTQKVQRSVPNLKKAHLRIAFMRIINTNTHLIRSKWGHTLTVNYNYAVLE